MSEAGLAKAEKKLPRKGAKFISNLKNSLVNFAPFRGYLFYLKLMLISNFYNRTS